MADLSLIEFFVYGLIAYIGMIFLIASAFKKDMTPDTTILGLVRVIFLIPSIIAAGIISGSGINITTEQAATNNIIKDLNNTDTWQETTQQVNQFVLINPVWITFNFLIFIVLLVYVVQQILMWFDAIKKRDGSKY